jgi:two-component system response regulator PilR (NtrC family)
MEYTKGRILIIEDEKSMREVLRILLEEEGYEITAASNGLEGMEYLKNDIFDLVVTDIKMPKADGFEVLKKVKELSPSTIVIIITAFGTTESTIEAMKLGHTITSTSLSRSMRFASSFKRRLRGKT